MEKEGKPSRLVLPCADDDGVVMCYLCYKYVSSVKALYRHMRCHTDSDWREVLPESLKTCSEVIVRYTLFDHPIPSDSDNEYCSDEEELCGGSVVVDLTKALPEWNTTGKMRNKRGRPDMKKGKGPGPGPGPVKKLKKDEVAVTKKDHNVVFDFDLNNDATEDEAALMT